MHRPRYRPRLAGVGGDEAGSAAARHAPLEIHRARFERAAERSPFLLETSMTLPRGYELARGARGQGDPGSRRQSRGAGLLPGRRPRGSET